MNYKVIDVICYLNPITKTKKHKQELCCGSKLMGGRHHQKYSGRPSTPKIQWAAVTTKNTNGRPSPPKIQGCQIDQQIQSWSKDQLQDRIANKGMAWPNYRRFSFPS